MASTQGNLAYLRSQGFESFPELFDESYDDIADWRRRVDRVAELARDFDVRSIDNPIVKQKLQHNSARFFDQQLTQQMTQQTIVAPLLNFIEK
jgi:hypothetical protein